MRAAVAPEPRAGARPRWSAPGPVIVVPASARVVPAGCGCGGGGGACACKGGGGSAPRPGVTPVYAFGALRSAFPSRSMAEEMTHAVESLHAGGSVARYFTAPTGYGLELLGQGEYDYLLRDACFILTIGPVDAYLVQPRTYPELYSLIAASNQATTPSVLSAVIGTLGPVAGPEACNGLQLPIVYCDQVVSFERKMVEHFYDASAGDARKLASLPASQLLLQMTDNMGVSPEHRALNYVAVRYPAIYGALERMTQRGFRLIRIEATASASEGARDVVFVYQDHDVGQVVEWRCTVDVSGEYPFLVRRLSSSSPGHPGY